MMRKTLTGASALALTLMLSPSAFAQLDEIVVTAQKREQSIQDVPISVTAIDSDYIDSRGITNIESLSSLAPNLKIENTPGNTTAAQISIRGGVTINPALTWEPTVGIYLNGSYIGKTQGSIFDVADIERLEVLRGPQGTLYGRNTLAGAINVITAKPTEEFGGKVKAGFGNYNSKLAKASINFGKIGPIRAKISGLVEKRDGFVEGIENPFPGVLSAGSLSADELQSPGQFFGFPLDLYVNPDRQETFTTDGDLFEKSKVQGHNLTATFETGIGDIKSITAFREMEWDDALDLDGSPLPLAHTQRLSDYDSFSQELQLTGENDRLNYVIGAYYFEDDGYTENPQFFFGGANIFDSQYGFTTEAFAAYGQLDYALNERFTITGGLRYTDETKTIERKNTTLAPLDIGGGIILPAGTPLIPEGTSGETGFNNLSPQVTLNYEASEDVNLYAKYAKGFKSGGFNGEAGTVAETLRPYDSEIVDSFEIGAKTRFWDGRAQLNAAAFFNDHKDMQLSVFTAEGAAASDIRNAGGANIKGFEIEGLFQLNDHFLLRANYGHLSTKYTEFIEAGIDEKDNRAFPHAPKNTFSTGFDWDAMQTDYGDIRLSVDANHSGSYFTFPYSLTPTDPQPAFNSQAPARTLVNGRIALTNIPIANNEVELAVWGKNIFDKEYLANFIDFGPGFGGLTNGYFGAPATYGVTLGVNF